LINFSKSGHKQKIINAYVLAFLPWIASYKVTLWGTALSITPMEARIIEILMLNPGTVFTRQEIIDAISRLNSIVDERTVDVMVGRIRDAMKNKIPLNPIRTVRSVGYALNEQFGLAGLHPKKRRIVESRR
jgi:DNA-binding response OmpR family regulator